MDEYEAQYNKWFSAQSPELRQPVFEWNADNFLKLIKRSNITFSEIIEIGGAEGTNLGLFRKILPFRFTATNCDIGRAALAACKKVIRG